MDKLKSKVKANRRISKKMRKKRQHQREVIKLSEERRKRRRESTMRSMRTSLILRFYQTPAEFYRGRSLKLNRLRTRDTSVLRR